MEEISAWLENPEADYQQGVSLYVQHGKNRHLANIFLRKDNDYNRGKLRHELEKIAATPVVKTVALAEKEEKTQTMTEARLLSDEEVEFQYQLIEDEKKRNYDLKSALSESLQDESKSQEELAETAKKIEKLRVEYNALCGKQDHLKEYKKLPEEPKPDAISSKEDPASKELAEETLEELLKKKGNARSLVSKKKKALEKDPTSVKKQEAFAKANAELTAIEDRIKLTKSK